MRHLFEPLREPAAPPARFVPVAALTGDEAMLTTAIFEAENAAQAEIVACFGELAIDGSRAIEIMLSAYLTCVAVMAVKLGLSADQYAGIARQAHVEAGTALDVGSDIQGEA